MAGETIGGRYVLEQPLGGGAMGAVWRARDTELERDVAVKLLAPQADRARFEREARAAAALAHPNICQVYDYGEGDQAPYMVLEYLPGGTLEDRLRAGTPLPDDEAGRIAHELASGLAHAHARGLVHRDLKPANILFDAEGRAKIADFGIARLAGAGTLTEAGTVLGTAAYISPEQAGGLPATPASDVYSFGAILYRMLTGRTPFVSKSAMELVRMHQEEQPAPVEELRRDAPPALAALAMAALAKDPARRPQDGEALADVLAGSVEPTTVLAGPAAATRLLDSAFEAPPTQVIRRSQPGRRRSRAALPLLLAAAAVLAIAGVAAAILVTRGSGDGASGTGSISLPGVSTGATTGRSSSSASTSSTSSTAAVSTTAPTTSTPPTTSVASSTTTTTRSTTPIAPSTTVPSPPPPPTTTPPATTSPPPPTSTTDTTTPLSVSVGTTTTP